MYTINALGTYGIKVFWLAPKDLFHFIFTLMAVS